jgi:hypothetical protein
MKTLKPTLLAITLIIMVSSTALAGNIGGLRTTGNIGGMRSAGNIGGMRTAGSAPVGTAPSIAPGFSRFDLESALSGTLTALVRMLLESGAL